MDITVILNAHSEGSLAHFSCLSLKKAMEYATNQSIQIQAIAVLDNPSDETSMYFLEKNHEFLEIVTVKYSDLGMSRNHGANIAKGKYLAFLDADDLWSFNWLYEAFHFAEKLHTEAVYHPEISYYFGHKIHAFPHVGTDSPQFSKWELAFTNYWTSLIFVNKQTFLKIPQMQMNIKSGFGFEDWQWHCETIAKNIPHKVVENTAHFIRSKKNGLLNDSINNNCVLPPTMLFEPTLFKT